MPVYSRRRFLQLAGIALVSSQLPSFAFLTGKSGAPPAVYQGRTLMALTVHSSPRLDSPALAQLWPDSIVSILDTWGEWYQVAEGYVRREQVQPMLSYQPETSISLPTEPFWAEVAGPVASIRRYCAANAPLITRVGHGGILHVVDALPDNLFPWYGVASGDGQWLGWTQAVHWRPVQAESAGDGERELEIDTHNQRLTLRQNGEQVLQASCSTAASLQSGVYSINDQRLGGVSLQPSDGVEAYHGVPWLTHFGSYDLAGVYWHNAFGATRPGPAVQVTPLLARWLYSWLNSRSRVVVL